MDCSAEAGFFNWKMIGKIDRIIVGEEIDVSADRISNI